MHTIDSDHASSSLHAADRLVEAGRPLDAIRALTEANRDRRHPAVEQRLVELRHGSFDAVPRLSSADWPASIIATNTELGGLPEMRPEDLSTATLRDGLSRYGCVLVRGLIPPAQAADLAIGIDEALAAYDAAANSGATPPAENEGWYAPFKPHPGAYKTGGQRKWVRASGAVWTADSPRMLFDLLEVIDDAGIGALVTDYLGERPTLSANKCTLRRVPLDTNTGWHQDGAFLGAEVHTLNLWLSLAHCGEDAPGLDIVPRRFDDLVEAGTGGALFDWAVGDEVARRAAGAAGVIRPLFAPGDALLFDHLLLHRTAVGPSMTKERHAIETWFFSPSSYPTGQIPLVY